MNSKKVAPICTIAEDWTSLLDRRGKKRTWLGADGIYSVSLDGNDAYGSATSDTKTFFIFSDSIMGNSDDTGFVTWAPGQPSQTSAILTGKDGDPDNIRFVWGTGGNMAFGPDTHLFGEYKWMLDCFVVDDAVYIFGFPEIGWKPQQIDMIKIPIVNGEPDYKNYSKTADITELFLWDRSKPYACSFGSGVTNNTAQACAPDPDGYIYIYGYRDHMDQGSRKDMIAARIHIDDFPNFTKVTYFDGKDWCDDIEKCAPLIRNISTEVSVSPIPVGPCKGKWIAVYTEATESPFIKYAIGDTPVGPFSEPVTCYEAPEHGQDNGGMYTYNAKAHPHLSRGGKLLISYNTNNRNTFGHQATYDCYPRFVWLDLESI